MPSARFRHGHGRRTLRLARPQERRLDRARARARRGGARLRGLRPRESADARGALRLPASTSTASSSSPARSARTSRSPATTYRRGRSASRVRAGEAVFEITMVCDPCHRMDELRHGLRAELDGKRGMLARVVEAGEVAVGDRSASSRWRAASLLAQRLEHACSRSRSPSSSDISVVERDPLSDAPRRLLVPRLLLQASSSGSSSSSPSSSSSSTRMLTRLVRDVARVVS